VRDSTVAEWSRRSGPLHRRNAICKLAALVVLLVAVATCPMHDWTFPAAAGLTLLACVPAAALPLAGVVLRAAVVVLFVLPFALMIALDGDATRASAMLVRAYCSAIAIVMYAGVTPFPETLFALRRVGLPAVLVEVVQFVYRYLFVIGEQARSMRVAAASRGAVRLKASAGAVATLFARSYQRAEGVHRSMLSRGYNGDMPILHRRPIHAPDVMLVAGAVALSGALRVGTYLLSK
jgi:cobalt/nickel transport system permease protein